MAKGEKEKPAVEPVGEKKKRPTMPIQVETEIQEMLATIAAHDNKSVSELASPLLRQWVITNYARVQREIAARLREIERRDAP